MVLTLWRYRSLQRIALARISAEPQERRPPPLIYCLLIVCEEILANK
ncbi:hypothetical protein [Nostoc commune]|nr:hypothetical protein [Nostoc commune]